MEPLLGLKRTAGSPHSARNSVSWKSWREAKTNIMHHFRVLMGEHMSASAVKLTTNITQSIPLVFLKQFRDIADTRRACYQAVVEAPIHIQTFRQGGILPDAYTLSVHSLESHPLAQALGLKLNDGKQSAALGVWMQVDFSIDVGKEIWRMVKE